MITKALLKKIRKYVKPKYLLKSEIRRCKCCGKISFIACLNEMDEFRICLRCRANLRYEMLAECLDEIPDLENKLIVEMDDRSPLYRKLKHYKNYIRTFYSEKVPFGTITEKGTRCEDIQNMTFKDNSIDLMISSDVLEHVCDIDKAFGEMKRVLKPGGKHIFTVPMYNGKTRQRATIENGKINYLMPPEYHCDPEKDGNGFILVFWDYGMDLAERYTEDDFKVSVLKGPFGKDGKIVWCAEKLSVE